MPVGLDRAQDEGAPMVHVHRELHAETSAFDGRVNQFVAAMSAGFTPHHVAYYSMGVCSFAVDALQRKPERPGPAAGDVIRRRALLRDVGGNLSCTFVGLDRELAEARTGQLIRMVLHAQHGVIYCMAVTPREQVLATLPARADRRPLTAQAEVRQADRDVSELAGGVRRHLTLSRLNFGGWHTERPASPQLPAGERALPETDSAESSAESSAGSAGSIESSAGSSAGSAVLCLQGAGTDLLVDRCSRALDPEHLLFIGLYRDEDCQFSVDILDHPRAARFFADMSPAARRRFYTQLWQRFGDIYGELAQSVRPAIKGNLIRTVFDVEQGAIFCYRVGPGEYLVGVVIDQDHVSEADDRMGELAAWCEEADW